MTNTQDSWPAGATYVFQGTVAETADAGTHVVTLTVTPGVGSEFQLLSGRIIGGNTATAQTQFAAITDGTNNVSVFVTATDTAALISRSFPTVQAMSANTATVASGISSVIVSGTMQLILQVSTAAVSVTQTFAVVCRIHGAKPTATLNDTVGAFVATTNTDKVF